MVSWSWNKAKERVKEGVSKVKQKAKETGTDVKHEAERRVNRYQAEQRTLKTVREEAEWTEKLRREKRLAKEKINPSKASRSGRAPRPEKAKDLGESVFGQDNFNSSQGIDSFLGIGAPSRGSRRSSRASQGLDATDILGDSRRSPRGSDSVDLIGGSSVSGIDDFIHGSRRKK